MEYIYDDRPASNYTWHTTITSQGSVWSCDIWISGLETEYGMFIRIHLTSQSFIRAVLLQVILSSQKKN